MKIPEFWSLFLAGILLRGVGWLLLMLLAAHLLRRASAARRALVWQMTFVGLILLPLLLALPPLPLVQSGRSITPEAAVHLPLPTGMPVAEPSMSRSASAPSGRSQAPVFAALSSVNRSAGSTRNAVRQPSLAAFRFAAPFALAKQLFVLVWCAGAVWLLLGVAIDLFALRRLGRQTFAASPELYEAQREILACFALQGHVTLRIGLPESGLQAPVTWGIFRPVVALPLSYRSETSARCRAALLHELSHVRRKDWFWQVAAQSVCACYWCVPFVRLAAARLRQETEMACDDCVLAAGTPAPDYAAQILEIARLMNPRRPQLPGGALSMARPPLAEARIRAILDRDRDRRQVSRSTLALAALLPLLCGPLLALRAVASDHEPRKGQLFSLTLPEIALPISSTVDTVTAPVLPETPVVTRPEIEHRPLLRLGHPGANGPGQPPAAAPSSQNEGEMPREGSRRGAPPIAWGAQEGGVQVGLRLVAPDATFAPGAAIWQEAFLRNRSAQDVIVTVIGGYEEQGAPVITGAGGARIKVIHYFGRGFMWVKSTRVHPGETALVGRFAVAFQETGKDGDSPKEVAPGLSGLADGMPLALAGQGDYLLRQEVAMTVGDEKGPRKTALTGPIRIRIAGAPTAMIARVDHNAITDLSTAQVAWGPEHAGLMAGLLTVDFRNHYFVGERVRLAVVLRNVGQKPISFRHQTSFAFLEPPHLIDAAGKTFPVTQTPETVWQTLGGIRMTGVTFDMTSAPSADGPSRLRQSEIAPGQSIIGYYLTAFVVPPKWDNGRPAPGRYRVIQPVPLGLRDQEQLDTTLYTGGLNLEFQDPDAPVPPLGR